MRIALAGHYAVLQKAVEAHDGYVFDTTGDGLYAVFSDATHAVAAGLQAQADLQAVSWGEVGQLKVRMALRTGKVKQRGGHFVGPALRQCARLLAIGHGGQTLLSHTTAELVREALPVGASLRALGTHRLKDFASPEPVFELLHPALPAVFPPLKSKWFQRWRRYATRLKAFPVRPAILTAAAWVKASLLEQMAARSDDRFRLLTGGSRTHLSAAAKGCS